MAVRLRVVFSGTYAIASIADMPNESIDRIIASIALVEIARRRPVIMMEIMTRIILRYRFLHRWIHSEITTMEDLLEGPTEELMTETSTETS